MPSGSDPSAVVLRHLGEIGAGRCSITDRMIAEEPNPEMQQILVGLLVLHEDLEYERRRRAEADARKASLLNERREAIAARDSFISIASHELRTPMTSIHLQLELLLRAARKSIAPTAPGRGRIDQLGSALQLQIRRLELLVSELLDVARINSDRLDLHYEPLDVASVVREVVDRFESDRQRRGSTIEVEQRGQAVGQFDRLWLDTVLTNLLSNALRYGEGGPIEVLVEGEPDLIRIAIADSGIGIPEDQQGKLFQPFGRALTSRHLGGLGLGLWIVQKAARAMGGEIHFKTAVGEGSTFTVVLPTAPESTMAEAPAAEDRSSRP